MITRMVMLYRSKAPCKKKPAIFSTGEYTVKIDGREFSFDFEDMAAWTEIKDGHLYIDVLQQNLDFAFITIAPDEADSLLRRAIKEDFIEIYYDCYGNADETDPISLEPVEITFCDCSCTGNGDPIVVEGERFSNLEPL